MNAPLPNWQSCLWRGDVVKVQNLLTTCSLFGKQTKFGGAIRCCFLYISSPSTSLGTKTRFSRLFVRSSLRRCKSPAWSERQKEKIPARSEARKGRYTEKQQNPADFGALAKTEEIFAKKMQEEHFEDNKALKGRS